MSSSQNAITVLYRKYWQKLYIHAYNLLNDGESAKDVLSDVFCSVLENSEQFEGKTDLLPLFYVMVKNRCIDHIRHQNVVNWNAERYLEELYSGWTAKEYRDYEDKIDRMQESIRQMAPQMRIVVEEFFLNEKKCAEISEILNISDNTVRTHIARALKILRKRLSVFLLITV
ncbi:sigma-70 family RNA polymerase sigma factor [Bacteroides acidifaciens]|uniref:RNA polymerase sigma factor n=1 Tax=Bacteroides acidifaciens TaxID=85831 RepID=UPI002557F25A|nr:sigma-70 family RNA polymerase sigma factor [Bacteroides acidifaciens]